MKKLVGNRILKLAPLKIGSIVKTAVVNSVVSRVLQSLTGTAEMADRRRLLWLKGLVIVYGAISIALGFCAPYAGPLLQVSMTILGVIGGPILAVFTLGILVPYANQKVNNDKSRNRC